MHIHITFMYMYLYNSAQLEEKDGCSRKAYLLKIFWKSTLECNIMIYIENYHH